MLTDNAVKIADPTTMAGLFAVVMGLIKVIEHLIAAMFKKWGKPTTVVARIDPDLSQMIKQTSEQVGTMHTIMGKTDGDGVPMVYNPRSSMEVLREIATIMKDVHGSQERHARILERLEDRFEKHDRSDAMVFDRVINKLDRIENHVMDIGGKSRYE